MRFRIIAPLMLILICFNSCQNESASRRDLLPGFVGLPGEVLVVMDQKSWDSEAGELLRDKFNQAYQVLNQYEGRFKIEYKTPEEFNRFFRPYRSIVIVDIGDKIDNQEAKVEVIREQFAKDQIIFQVKAKNEQDFLSIFEKSADQIISSIDSEEIKRLRKKMVYHRYDATSAILAKEYGLSVSVSRGYKIVEQREDFVWLRNEQKRMQGSRNHDVEQGIMIYFYPYTNDSTFTQQFLAAKRDSVLQVNVPGGPEGSYMTTEYFYPPIFEDTELNGEYASIMRGLWTVKGDYMGGPYVSISTFDKLNQRIVTAEGYVYAPNFEKREYIRELEAAISTLTFNKIQ